jgi:drug/metabolite transporter (DMT)-like permease
MIPLKTLAGYLLVSVLWGCTNPFIKHAQMNTKTESSSTNSTGTSIPSVASSNKLSHTLTSNAKQAPTTNTQTPQSGTPKPPPESIFQTLKRFVQDLNVLIPWMFNQLGSVVFFMLLSTEPISIASPVANSMTFLFTAVTSYTVFNERVRYPWLLICGTAFIIGGTVLCMI